MNGGAPPPPPHGENPKTTNSNLPPGKYDIFIIPPHSSGSGFLYLPSLQPNVNSFAAGFASALVLVVLAQSMAPAFRAWWNSFQGMGNMGMMLLVIAVGVGAWSLGRTQQDGGPGPGGGSGGASGGGYGPSSGAHTHANAGGPAPDAGPPPPPPPHNETPPRQSGPTPGTTGSDRSKSSWQQRPSEAETPKTPKPDTAKNAWEKARDETRRKAEERKAKDAEQKRKEDIARRIRELREKEASERAKRETAAKEKADREAQAAREKAEKEARAKAEREKEEREKEQRETQAKEREQREARLRELRERDLRERLERERTAREKLEEEAKEREATRLKEDSTRKSAYAFSSVGERTNPWPNGKSPSQAASPAKPNPNPSSPKRPPAPTARTYNGNDEEGWSYRPYDTPKKHNRRRSGETVWTQSSYAPSMSTARTTPPPSFRMPYSTKDPEKIVIKSVYCFMNQFAKTPASQLISGQGSVTDGLILRLTTEGIFIDDDVRGVPQREWDVKAWTLKLMEVWCSSRGFAETSAASNSQKPARARLDRGKPKILTGKEADVFLEDMLQNCTNECCLAPHGDVANSSSGGQTGQWKQRGLHVLRANIKDQEGKRYLFVLTEEEGWKLAEGLKKLKKGAQARQLGVQAMSPAESRDTLQLLGW